MLQQKHHSCITEHPQLCEIKFPTAAADKDDEAETENDLDEGGKETKSEGSETEHKNGFGVEQFVKWCHAVIHVATARVLLWLKVRTPTSVLNTTIH